MIRTLSASTAALALLSGAAAAYDLTILHTNDFHDRFEPINAYDSTCSSEDNDAGECFGGIARMVTAVEDAREAAAGDVILLDAGDQFQGSLFFTQYGGDLSAEFMTQLGYDAMAVGNHEFDDGPEGLAKFLEQVEFPVLSANIDVSGNDALSGNVPKSIVIETEGDERIGIVSVLAEDTPETSSPGDDVIFSSIIDAAQQQVDMLTDDGVNKIVMLTHVGLPADRRLAEGVTGIDLIIGGHSHTLLGDMEGAAGPYPTMVNDVPIFQAYAYGKYLGEIDVTFSDDGEVTEISGTPVLLDSSVAEDEATLERVAALAEPLEELRQEVVGESTAAIDGTRESCRAVECEMGNLVTDAMLARTADQGVQIAITNGGGLRASIEGGEVTMGDVLTVLPFQNTLSTFEVDGAAIVAALENGASQMEEGAGRFAQVAGMSYTVDPSAEVGSRISEVMVGGEPIDESATYAVASNNYVRNGGDGYQMFVDAENAYDFGPDLADVTAEYLSQNTPYTPVIEGRITVR
ncbi:bifunctional metallophosphatase/5'-nucleotidase [Palleronia sp. LCG004]|uniref:bifunctional metallophosphatase/5'-nucleotidase n=1 Tax=Palleronia sp. LCG004 TaxID=3079304 RepID=UPI002942BCB9|nr:bifunctional metallophosphatase/5'-nucleotidase [Palleronia sp. LCG004]WOI56616.1 bifunctional metallophosphatase/5'-nucleotidase [Palleronia sp. LCG004]